MEPLPSTEAVRLWHSSVISVSVMRESDSRRAVLMESDSYSNTFTSAAGSTVANAPEERKHGTGRLLVGEIRDHFDGGRDNSGMFEVAASAHMAR